MKLEKFSKFLQFDILLVFATAFLTGIGLLAVYSLSLEADLLIGFSNFQRQLVFLFLASVSFFVFSFIDYRIWRSYSGFFYLVGIGLLFFVLIIGKTAKGATGWFSLGFFNFQPAELMKFFLIIALAKYFSQINGSVIEFRHLVVSFIYTSIPAFLVILQPDMGGAVIFFIIWFGMIFLAGLRFRHFIFLIGVGFLSLAFLWIFIFQDYQKQRLAVFIDPEKDPLGSGYNVIQSMIAVGSGGVLGKGVGFGSQSQLNFLPEKHNDFIFAAIAEESGFVGSFLVILCLWVILYRMKKSMDVSRDDFGKLLVGGVMVMIFSQSFINIGMNLGVFPVAGLSLPLVSYGGSFLLITMSSIGITQSVWHHRVSRRFVFMD